MATKNVLSAELTEEELEKINSLTSNMLLCVLKKFDLLNEDIPDRRTCPSSKAEWTDLLLHILFNGCAMTFQAADSGLMTRSSHRKGKFRGHQCQKYYMGSLTDGLGCAIPGRFSDTDIMNVLDGYIATQGQTADTSLEKTGELETNTSSHTNTEKIYLNQGSFPCYTKLKQDDSSAKLIEIAKSLNYGPVIRSEKREELLAHTFEFDNSIAVQCDTWPQESLPWLNRHRLAQWPTPQMIGSCSELPVYIVSKAHASNADDKLEWRYSFGRQEVLLLREISIMMKMTYIVTKFLVKQVIMSDDSLSTYHLKTLMLWFCEKKSVNDFDGKSLYENILEFFDFVLHNLERGAIHHYFIPENNLVAHLPDSTVCDIKATLFNLRDNILGCLANSHLVKKYPFEIYTLAKHIEENPELNAMTFKKCQSICLDIVMEYVIQSHLPHFRCAFTCAQYVLPQDKNCQIFMICQSLLKKSSAKTSMMADKIFGKSYKSLFLLTLALYEELRADIPLFPKMTLTEYIDTEEKNIQLECSIADTFSVTGIHSTAKTTRILCLVIYEIAKKNKIERSIVTQVFRNLANTISMSFVENGHQYLLYRFKEIAMLLQVPDSEIEVVFATLVRLWNATDGAIALLETISSLFDGVSMDAVLKHLVFAIFLYAENETIPDEITSQWKLIKNILKSGTIPNAINVFLFVAATCIFTKFVNNLKGEIKVFLERLLSFKLGKLHNNIQELGDTLTELLESETLDLEKLFHVQCCYAKDCMKTTGVSFVVSVMDDLLEPHHNLGVLAAVGIEMTATEDLDKAIQVLELWTHRYIQANVEQNPDLIVKIFGKLGHLYHIKSNVVSRRRSVYVRKADIMFQTALKENNPDIAVMIDYIIFVKQNFPKILSSSIDKALESTDAMKISVYFKNSEPIFESEELREFQDMLKTNGIIKLSSSVLAYYFYIMLSLEKSLPRQTCTTPIQKMEELIQVMEATLEEMQGNGEDCENQKTVLEGSCLLVKIARSRVNLDSQDSGSYL